MNLFFPIPQYQNDNLFSGYLPENHRVPGLKRSPGTESDSTEPITALDNFKLQLITFGVNGSLLNSNPLAELAKRVDQDDDSDDEEEVGAKRARIGDSNNSIVLKRGFSPYNFSDKGIFTLENNLCT